MFLLKTQRGALLKGATAAIASIEGATSTIEFLPTAMLIRVLHPTQNIFAVLKTNAAGFYHYSCSRAYFVDLNIQDFFYILNSASDDDIVTISGHDPTTKILFKFENRVKITISDKMVKLAAGPAFFILRKELSTIFSFPNHTEIPSPTFSSFLSLSHSRLQHIRFPTFYSTSLQKKFSVDKRSIFPVGDITEVIPDEEADVAVLEEPEHLTWYHHGKRWKTKFRWVVGVVHTNYLEYVRREKNAMHANLLKHVNSWVISIYCHKVIRLSAATQDLRRSVICNVHGVNPQFLEIGKKKKEQLENGNPAFTKGAYYIGKMVWNKGYKELLQLLRDHQKQLSGLEVDLYGSGEDSEEVKQAADNFDLAVRVHPGRDHADPLFHDYKLFLNPSTTDVLCTTTAEALAMGKLVVCANHPSNEFFKQFPNTHVYNDGDGFVAAIKKALAEEPVPVTAEQMHQLSWEAATERFLTAAELDSTPAASTAPTVPPKKFDSMLFNTKRKVEDASAFIHYAASGFESTRKVFGAIPRSLHPSEEQCQELGWPSTTGR
ncbi:hypothetical protein Nepgr_024330 [Nepenthes gracilis]|uniref:Digalactosyldiacylglycerol synthase 2, chloroplastic n=1 Tax=Nepenthes gracilis TaxID=150966 RepID=A0AAD3T5T1_NEPGR|nr:hypothetical protein Nepgr_024330 [Nepenthes gracilis]